MHLTEAFAGRPAPAAPRRSALPRPEVSRGRRPPPRPGREVTRHADPRGTGHTARADRTEPRARTSLPPRPPAATARRHRKSPPRSRATPEHRPSVPDRPRARSPVSSRPGLCACEAPHTAVAAMSIGCWALGRRACGTGREADRRRPSAEQASGGGDRPGPRRRRGEGRVRLMGGAAPPTSRSWRTRCLSPFPLQILREALGEQGGSGRGPELGGPGSPSRAKGRGGAGTGSP